MNQHTDDQDLMVSYLLGEAPEAEQLRLEERFFTDDDYYEQLLALEDELRYDYAAGALTTEQRAKFERRFLASPQARQRAALAEAVLGAVAGNQPPPVRTPVIPEAAQRDSLWGTVLAFFSFQNPVWQFSLAATAALLLIGASWLFYETVRLRSQVQQLETARASQEQQRAQQTAADRARAQALTGELERERQQRAQLEQELAKQKAERERQPSPSASVLSFILAPGLVRDVDGPKRLTIPPSVNQVRLQLTLKRPGAYRSYRVVLQTLDGAELWQQNLPSTRPQTAGQSVTVNLPAKLVPPGDYVLALKGRAAGGELEELDEYYFSTVRQ
jgi:hypothetical protein